MLCRAATDVEGYQTLEEYMCLLLGNSKIKNYASNVKQETNLENVLQTKGYKI